MASYPVPIGVGASFSPVAAVVATNSFTIGTPGYAIVTFQPLDVNDPGLVTLFDSAANTILTMDRAGYENVMVPGGGLTYYFTASKGAALLAMTSPSIWR